MKSLLQRSERGAANQRADSSHATEKTPVSVDGIEGTSTQVLRLQRTVGNQAVLRMLRSGRLQTKLEVGPAGDAFEQEADQVANRVMRMPDPQGAVLRSDRGKLQRKCTACEQEDEKIHPKLSRKESNGASTAGSAAAPAVVHSVLQQPGMPLDSHTRAFFEPRLGQDLAHVRVHTGESAAQSAESVAAQAYTVGSDVVFGAGRYAPASPEGQHLLAHELAHVVQQTHGAPRTVSRKPTKRGVKNNDYSFSTNCGWIDWGHANPGLAKKLIASVQKASDDLKASGTGPGSPSSSPTMAAKKFGIVFSSASMQVTLARPLSPDEVLAVSLSMFKNLSVIFEIQQEWTDFFSGSSFSQEDLPSNLISFYRAARGFTTDDIKQYCDSQDVDTSVREFEKNSDFQKNRTFSPIGATGPWPAELSTIDETKGAALYKVTSTSVGSPASGFTFCPLYRIEGTIDDTDLIIFSVGGATFTAADNVRVVPTYRVDSDRVSGRGHVPYMEVKPYGQSDADALKAKGIKTPLYVPSSVLNCVGEIEGGDMASHLMRMPESPGSEPESSAAPEIVAEVLNSPGEPLDNRTRAFMEPRFSRDFSDVRVHTDERAAESARAVHAHAYTVGRDVVFAAGQYDPGGDRGRKLLAHELTHTIQQSSLSTTQGLTSAEPTGTAPEPALGGDSTLGPGIALQRAPDDTIDVDLVQVDPDEDERLRKRGINLPKVSQDVWKKLPPEPKPKGEGQTEPKQSPPATPTPVSTPSGFVSAAASAAPCPAAPAATTIPPNCLVVAPVPDTAPPDKESPVLPTVDPAPFGKDTTVENFATGLADCHAARVVKQEVDKRFKAAVESAKKSATADAKADTDKTMSDAVVGIDPKDKKGIAEAKKKAAEDAKVAAKKKIADAQAAVQKPDVDTVRNELAAKFKDELQSDFAVMIAAALRRFGASWLARMKAVLEKAKAKLKKDKTAKPKVPKGEPPPTPRPPGEIAAEIEAEMVKIRCEQDNWAANQVEGVKRGWMAGRREEVDFQTVSQTVTELKNFNPARTVSSAELTPIPSSLQSDASMPGVAPEVAEFLTGLESLEPNFKAGNYKGHGGGSWAGAGFSVDLTLSGTDAELDDRGFYKHDNAVRFLLNLDQTAKTAGGRWRVLYNDFSVAEEVNHTTGTRNVVFVGNAPGGGLNWHGPAPMVLHFHLDIELPPPAPSATPSP